ncbi:MAG: hypothetical protein NW207_05025 [Cytophagales bacterium]|nr:hypothetical protein [Cytophagales bacterium]
MKKIIYTTLAMSTLLASCGKKEELAPNTSTTTPALVVSTYDSTGYVAATTTQYAVRNALKKLVDEAKKGRITGTGVNLGVLQSLYTSGSTSLKTVTNTYYDSKIQDYLKNLSDASGTLYTPSATISGNGGVYGGYLFDEYGLEYEQLVEKGLFTAALYNHAISGLTGVVTTTTVHQIVAISGLNTKFPNTDKTVGAPASGGGTHVGSTTPDVYMAAYGSRRDKSDGKGLYSQIKYNLTKAQAAANAGDKYKDTLSAALSAYKLSYEKISAATVINYCIDSKAKFSKTSPSDADKASALHAYGEAVGFMTGWRGVSQEHKKITDAQIDEILTLLLAPISGNASSYKFITEPAIYTPNLQTVQDKLKAIYGFSDAEMTDFAKNWVNEQKR